VAEKDAAIDRLKSAIRLEMDQVARSLNLDSMVFGVFTDVYRRDGKKVKSTRLDELQRLYCDEVHSGGLSQDEWTKERGWS